MIGDVYTAPAMPRTLAPMRTRTPRSEATLALLVAFACAVAMLVLWALAEHVYALRLRDAILLHDFTLLDRGHVDSLCTRLLHLLEPALFTLWGIGLVLIALARSRPRIALAVAVVMGFAPLSAELLKPLMAHPHLSVGETYIGPASWPSGHATAATALALCVVLVTPARWRALALACAVLFMLAVGFALLVRAWHMPSDVLGGYLLGSLWVALALAGVRASEARWPRREPDGAQASVG